MVMAMPERKPRQDLLPLMEQRIQTPRTSRGSFLHGGRAQQSGAALFQRFTEPLAFGLEGRSQIPPMTM